jgi:hypothetical protein
MKVGDIVKETEFKKIVIKAIDEDTGDVLYEHIGKGKYGFEWPTGALVIEKGTKNGRPTH